MMEIDWKYDNVKNNIEIGDIVTFEFDGKHYTGVVSELWRDNAHVLNHGSFYIIGFSKIIARASFDDVVRPAKPKSKFPAGALTWGEIVRQYREDGGFVWVKFDTGATYWPAITDCLDGDYVIIWCGDSGSWLHEDGYGEDYVCYLNKPDED